MDNNTSTFFKKHETTLWLLAMAGLGIFWFEYFMQPFGGLLNSDDAVPYIATTTPWSAHDFYYWGAQRFGWVYPIFWKAIGKYIFGGSAAAFFRMHCVIYFLGVGIFAAMLRSYLLRFAFVVMFLPITFQQLLYSTAPGQLYPVLLLITAIFCWRLRRWQTATPLPFEFALYVCLLYWLHDGAGLLGIATLVFFSLAKTSLTPSVLRERGKMLLQRLILPFGFWFLVCRQFKNISRSWGVNEHTKFATFDELLANLINLSKNGLPIFGHDYSQWDLDWVFYVGAFTALIYGCVKFFRQRDNSSFENLFLASTLITTLLGIV